MTAWLACIGGEPDPGEEWLEVDADTAEAAALSVADEYDPDDGTSIYIRNASTGETVRVQVITDWRWVVSSVLKCPA